MKNLSIKFFWIVCILSILVAAGCSDGQIVQTPNAVDATREAFSPLPTPSPVESLSTYAGKSAYGKDYPDFEVKYDPDLWDLVYIGDNRTGELNNTQIISCTLMLAQGAMESPLIQKKKLGPYLWNIGLTNNQQVHFYWTGVSDALYMSSFLRVPDSDLTEHNRECTNMAEDILSTAVFVAK